MQSVTRVYANANCKDLIWLVRDSEDLNGTQEVQSHHGNLQGMLGAIADRKATCYHVSITNGFHLIKLDR